MNKTDIEWADYTWNPLTGCLHTCEYCYARRMSKRFSGDVRANLADERCKKENGVYVLDEPFISNNDRAINYPFGFEPTFHKYRLDWPGNAKNGANIFVGSMTDLFGKWVPDEVIKQVFDSCETYDQHNYMFLTKNPSRYLELDEKGLLPRRENMWYGTTITDDETGFFFSAEHNTFLSIEPILKPFNGIIGGRIGVKWVIIGAETGNRKNKVVPQEEWIQTIVRGCYRQHIPVFMKDSLINIVKPGFLRREFPEQLRCKKLSDKMHDKLYDKCMYCEKEMPMKEMTALLYRKARGKSAKRIGYACKECFKKEFGGVVDEETQLQNDE